MKNITLVACLIIIHLLLKAQLPVNDSVSLNTGYTKMSFYSFANGEVANVNAKDWDLQIWTRLSNATIRINDGANVSLYKLQNDDTTAWNSIDTTGMTALHNSDTSWAVGAFNVLSSGQFDFGWGGYDIVSHNVTGIRIFVVKTINGRYKKIWVKELVQGDAYKISIGNLDNSGVTTITLKKSDYPGKEFFYYAIDSAQIKDIEPLKTDWDLVLRRYQSFVSFPLPAQFYPVMGVLSNPAVSVAEARGVDVNSNDTTGLSYDYNISMIGSDWKNFNQSTFQYDIVDSLAYFVAAQNGNTYKLVFSGFGGTSTGKVFFSKTQIVQQCIPGAPSPSFVYSATNLSVSFTDLSTNSPTSWLWSFGDGTTSVQRNPIHVYNAYGTYNVCLTVSNLCGLNQVCNSVLVQSCGGRYYDEIFSGPIFTVNVPGLGQIPDMNILGNYSVPFGSAEGQTLDMYVFQPDGDTTGNPYYAVKRPLIVLAFGGSFTAGFKESPDIINLCQAFTARGFVTASIKYRLNTGTIDSATMLKQVVKAVQDAKAAVRFFYKDAATTNTYRIDTNNIYMGGTSAGATIGVHMGYVTDTLTTPQWFNQIIASVGGLEGNSGNPGYSSRIQGVINLSGFIIDTSWIDTGDIPMVSMQGNQDGTVPYCSDIISVAGTPLLMVDGCGTMKIRTTHIGLVNPFYTWRGANHVPYVDPRPTTSGPAYMDTTIWFIRDFLFQVLTGNQCGQSLAAIGSPAIICGVPISGTCSTSPVPSYTYSATNLNISFTDQSTNTPTSWSWTFGDGTSSTSRNPSHSYSTGGGYTVCLTATNSCGSNSTCQSVTVQQCTNVPVPSFIYNSTNLSVSFTDQSTNTPTSWSWTFGDGTSSTSRNPSHSYSTAGNYNVCLTSTNSCGSNTSCQTVSVTCIAPSVTFGYTVSGTSVSFIDNSANTPTSWSWTFGDGASSNQQNPVHNYASTGTYTACLSATNSCGSNTSCQSITLTCNVNAGVTASSTTICSGDTATLTASTGSGYSYQWYRNGSIIQNANSASYKVTQIGSYTVAVSNGSCSATSTAVSIVVNPAPTVSITASGSTTFCAGGSVTLQATSGFASYLWSNGGTSSSTLVTASGAYTVTVTDANGCTASSTFLLNASSLLPPDICIVGLDSATNKNIIVWEKPVTTAIDSYIIYKETNQADLYVRIGSQPYNAFSTFIDASSIPQQQAYRYKLGVVDSCGSMTLPGNFHKTIHLTINQGIGNTWNLIWSHYEGFTFPSYNIYRGTSQAGMTLLTTIASNLNSFTDLNPPSGPVVVFYQLEVVNPNSCNPTAKMQDYSVSRSNIVNTGSVGIADNFGHPMLNVYPNPFSEATTIEIPEDMSGSYELRLIDLVGNEIRSVHDITDRTIMLKRENLASGIYFIEMKGEKRYFGKVMAK